MSIGKYNCLLTFGILCAFLLSIVSCNEGQKKRNTWMTYGGSSDQSKYFEQDQINLENVQLLDTIWTYPTNDEKSYQNNPIIVDTVMYILGKNNSLIALNAKTGKELWMHTGLTGIGRRGLSFWQNADGSDKRILFTLKNTLQAINAVTGQSILSFGQDGAVDLRKGLGRDEASVSRISSATPGAVFDSIIVLGSSPGESYMSTPGHIRGYNVVTGEMEWVFHTIPHPGELGYETWPVDAYKYIGGVNCWGEITIDQATGIAYVPLGSPTYDYYGGDRIGQNLFGNCLVALDAKTGKRIWHYQTIHHDLWDYDLTAAPQLLTINKDNKKLDVVAIATKQGFLFVLDRATGEPVWPVEERAVPPSDVPGEQAWPTQPFSLLPPFNRQTVNEEDISPAFFTEKEYNDWKERIRKARKGLFTPPALEETVAMPGAVGGANWGNTASNPSKGLFYVLTQDYPSIYKLEARPPALSPAMMARMQSRQSVQRGQLAFVKHCQSCHGKDLGGTALAPSLLESGASMNFAKLNDIVRYGLGRMPAIVHIEDEEVNDIINYIKEASLSTGSGKKDKNDQKLGGLIVGHGGAPGAAEMETMATFNPAGDAYPKGVNVSVSRYYTGYGLGFPFLLKGPWSSITAYDLNKGTIIWSKPLGEDPQALAAGLKDHGVPTGSQRNGMIVTSNGIIFTTVTNGKIYAMDATNGKILWTGTTPLGIATIPSMYEIDGRVYLAVNATTPQIAGWNLSEEEKTSTAASASKNGAYFVYALPEIKK